MYWLKMNDTMNKRFFTIISGMILLILLNSSILHAEYSQGRKSKTALVKSFPDSLGCIVQPFYRHRPDGKPGREIILNFKGPKFSGNGTIELECSGEKEMMKLNENIGIDHYSILLPPGAGVKSGCEVKITLKSAGHEISGTFTVSEKRQWSVYIYPHSHVDIGYTNTQANVEIIHKRNLINGIELAKKTADYPKDARYLWNPEVLWPVERYLKTATSEERENIIDAVRKGYLHLDAGYIHTNTSSSADEEIFEYFRPCRELEKLTGTKIETLVQVDVPGMSWGVVPVAAKLGIKYCFAMNNGSDRVGLSTDLSFRPFWWLGQDGKSKILFLQPGSYTPGANAKGFAYWPLMAGQTDPSKLIQIVKTDHPRDHFIDKYLADKLPELENSDYYPYDIFAMSWAMADNTPIDADLPEAVKSWNEDYAFPHLIIASATEIMRTFEEKYGNQLPVLKGDFTEYWTDGLGTAAKQTGMNRNSKERLIQTETLWTMLHPDEAAPRSDFDEAWRNVIMGTEHTWCYMDPSKQPISNDILKVKFGFFKQAEDRSKSLLTKTLSAAADSSSSIVGVFNTLSWIRSGLVSLTAGQSKVFNSICDENGKTILSQRLSTGELVFNANDIPALGIKNYFLKKKKIKTTGQLALCNILDNGIVRITVDPQTGDISSLTNEANEFVDHQAPCAINSFRYLNGDDSPDKASGTRNVKISIKENGPLVATLQIESDAEGCNRLLREITIIAGQPQIEIKNIVDKQAILKKEGIHFGFAFNIPEPTTRVDIPWGIMELEKDQLSAANRNWIAFQRWLDISNSERALPGVLWMHRLLKRAT
jgi:alpha-mannosidase